jgi:hypothetical protein
MTASSRPHAASLTQKEKKKKRHAEKNQSLSQTSVVFVVGVGCLVCS